MMEYLQRLQSLRAILQSFFHKFPLSIQEHDYHELKVQIEEWGKASSDLGSDLEITFRSIFQEDLLTQLLTDSENIENSLPIQFIKFTIEFSLIYPNISNAFGKIPFLLIEDLLEDQTIQYSKRIWTVIESLVEKITKPSLFSKGKFVVLKTCNSLLKKLSKSYDTEFCGRILMFLAAVYPISERSALNLSGKINLGNNTYYETKEKYIENIRDLNSKEYDTGDNEGKDESAMKVAKEEGEEFDPANLPFIITYDLYESFWKLQSFFASDLKGFDAASANTWNEFMENAKRVFEILNRSLKWNNSNQEKGNNKNSSNTDNHDTSIGGDDGTEDYFGCKYLTSSQLFSLQLKDPMLRRQIAVQFLFFSHYLRTKAIPAVENESQRVKYEKDLKWIHDQSKGLIETSSSSNQQHQTKNFIDIIQRIFSREEHWISWKNTSCTVFERSPPTASTTTTTTEGTGDETTSGGKRKFDEMNESKVTEKKEEEAVSTVYDKALEGFDDKRRSFMFDLSRDNVTDIAKNLSANYPDFSNQIELYLEADDPEAGIEDEYHPKNDHLYSWRTRRLFAERHLTYFQYMQDGNLGRGFRKLRNLPEPVLPTTTDTNSVTAATEEQSLDNEGLNDEGAMMIEEDGEVGITKNGEAEEVSNEEKQDEPVPPLSTTSNQSTKPFAEPEDGEEVEEGEGDETKMEL